MTALVAVASHLPQQRVAVGDYLRGHGMAEARIRLHERYFGFSEIRLQPDRLLAGQLVAAAENLDELRGREDRVRYLVQARTMPVVAPYPVNPVHEVRQRLGLRHAQAFCLTQHACATALLGIDLAGRLLARDGDPDALALLLAGEKAFTSCAQVITDTGVMGEGTVAVLVRSAGPRDRMLGYASHTYGEFHDGAWMSPETNARFHDTYPEALSTVVRAAVEQAGLRMDDIDLILPHNVNRMSWLRVLRLLGIRGVDRLFLDNLPVTGHCFGADAFVNYRSACDTGRLRPGDRYVMTAVGLGATFSAMTFEH